MQTFIRFHKLAQDFLSYWKAFTFNFRTFSLNFLFSFIIIIFLKKYISSFTEKPNTEWVENKSSLFYTGKMVDR